MTIFYNVELSSIKPGPNEGVDFFVVLCKLIFKETGTDAFHLLQLEKVILKQCLYL